MLGIPLSGRHAFAQEIFIEITVHMFNYWVPCQEAVHDAKHCQLPLSVHNSTS